MKTLETTSAEKLLNEMLGLAVEIETGLMVVRTNHHFRKLKDLMVQARKELLMERTQKRIGFINILRAPDGGHYPGHGIFETAEKASKEFEGQKTFGTKVGTFILAQIPESTLV